MLQLEFGESKPEESQSEQSRTETRKATSCSSETLKSNAGSVDRPRPDAPSRTQTIFGKVLYFASVSEYAGVVWSGARFRGRSFSRVHRSDNMLDNGG